MSKFIIKGNKELEGEIDVRGAKNSALKIIPASILSEETIVIKNLPEIADIEKSLELLKYLGADIKKSKKKVEINTKNINKIDLPHYIANKFRGSIMFVGPLLARFKEVKFPHPGGCVIGAGKRPIDLFVEGFKSFGAEVKRKGDFYHLKAKKLKGCEYFFPISSVSVTESLMMTSTLIEETTVLKNCAMEPEIKALADYLNKCGAEIHGAGTPTITINGVKKITAKEFKVIPDRIEAGSFAIMAAATRSNILISHCNPEHVLNLLSVFKKIGIPFEKGKDWLKIEGKEIKKLQPYDIKTEKYPGFPTDLQSPYTVLMTQAQGSSLIHETIYDRRLLFVDLLSQMGANITMCDPHRVVINGPNYLYGKKLISPDLRAGIALVIAALIAKGTTEIDNIYQIDRGYENLETRLKNLGADITRVD